MTKIRVGLVGILLFAVAAIFFVFGRHTGLVSRPKTDQLCYKLSHSPGTKTPSGQWRAYAQSMIALPDIGGIEPTSELWKTKVFNPKLRTM
jgi:hypothetical protein